MSVNGRGEDIDTNYNSDSYKTLTSHRHKLPKFDNWLIEQKERNAQTKRQINNQSLEV